MYIFLNYMQIVIFKDTNMRLVMNNNNQRIDSPG